MKLIDLFFESELDEYRSSYSNGRIDSTKFKPGTRVSHPLMGPNLGTIVDPNTIPIEDRRSTGVPVKPDRTNKIYWLSPGSLEILSENTQPKPDTVAKTWDQMTPEEKSSGVKGRTEWNPATRKYRTVFDVPSKKKSESSIEENKLYVKKITSEQELIEHAKTFAKNLKLDGVPQTAMNQFSVVCSTIFAHGRTSLKESAHITGGKQVIQSLQRLDQFSKLPVKVGTKVAIINSQLQGDSVELWGFTNPKTISKISRDPSDNSIKQFEFNNDPDDVWPRTESAEYNGQFLMYSAFFGDKKSADHALTMLMLQASADLNIRNHITEQQDMAESPNKSSSIPDWTALGEDLTVEDKISIFEAYYANGAVLESDENSVEYFKGLNRFSVNPVKNKKYIVTPLMLIQNRVLSLNTELLKLTFVDSVGNQLIFARDDGTTMKFPESHQSNQGLTHTFVFDKISTYDKFRTELSLKFDLTLPDVLSEGKKVDSFVDAVKKSEIKAGHAAKEAESIAWATANKRGMLNNKNTKKK